MKFVKIFGLVFSMYSTYCLADCTMEVDSTDQMTFTTSKGEELPKIIVPKTCQTFEITFKNIGTYPKEIMGHNFVITATSDVNEILNLAAAAGIQKDYIPDTPKIIAHSKLLGGSQEKDPSHKGSDLVKVDMSKIKDGTAYSFVCSFPGHYGLMNGKFIKE